jgi:hypothetical protein
MDGSETDSSVEFIGNLLDGTLKIEVLLAKLSGLKVDVTRSAID